MTGNVLAQISKAEQALIQADDIVDILDLRSQAKAVEIVAIAQGYAEIATKAKIFQLKAERKAGCWLGENIQWGGDPTSHRVTLNDLDISKHESSRWQLMSRVPEAKFTSWVDDRLATDQEITAGGLRMYARNIIGKPKHSNNYIGRISLVPQRCALEGFMIRCDGDLTHEHIVSKSKTRGNPKAKEYLNQKKNIAMTCYSHNVGKLSDTPMGRKIMILQKVYEHGFTEMKEYFDGVPWKVPQYEFTVEAMLDA